MADTFTPTLNLTKPEIDASAETWGQKLNADLDLLDAHAGSMQAFAASQPANISAAVAAGIAAAFPRGCIIAWAGAANQVPAGWLLCNGLNGTPNLADRFILGTAGTRAIWEAGGAFTGTGSTDAQGNHAHTGAVTATAITEAQMPSHQHGGSTDGQGDHTHAQMTMGNLGAAAGGYPVPVDGNYAARGVNTGGGGFHAHNIATDFRGGNQGHNHGIYADGSHSHNVYTNVVPPYFALCYIMRA